MAKRKRNWGDCIYICGRRWAVVYQPVVLDSDGASVHATTNHDKQVIEVATANAEDIRRSALLHEIDHATVKTVANAHPSSEEECAQAHETGLYSMFRDARNDWVWAVMREGRP